MSSRESSKAKKIQILDATTRLLKSKGLQALSFENVASEAGLSRQLIRYYFTDLESLMVDLCDHLGNGYRDTLIAGVVDVGQVERLKFFLDFFFDLSETRQMPDNLEVYDALVAFSVGSARLRDRMCEQYKVLGQVMVHELAIAYPELDGTACEEISFVFVSMMHAHWSFVASLGHSRAHSKLNRQAMQRLIESYVNADVTEPVMERPWSREA
ncbi:MAG: TetR/AcrR family transcriptional regulator [Arenibacterium sp.]